MFNSSSEFREYTEISSDITQRYIDYCRELEKKLNYFCRNDKNLKKIIELIFNEYPENTREYYMSMGMRKIIDIICRNNFNEEEFSEIRYHRMNIMENIHEFISDYIQVNNISEKMPRKAVKLDMSNLGYLYIQEDILGNEWEMRKYGYTNYSKDYISFLEKYADFNLNYNKKKEDKNEEF